MHLAVPRAVAHLFHIQPALNQGGVDWAWLSPYFHCELADWKALAHLAASRPAHLADIARCEPTHLRFCDSSGLGAGGVWLDLARTDHNIVWKNPLPVDIISITNSNLNLYALVLQKSTLLDAVPESHMAAPRSGSDNTLLYRQ